MPYKTKEQKSEYDKKRYQERREQKLAYMQKYRAENPEVRQGWQERNRKKINAQKREWRRKNRAKVLAMRQGYEQSERAKELQAIRRRKWAEANPLRHREIKLAAQYRRVQRIGGSRISAEELSSLLEDFVCGICSEPIKGSYHLDHIIPVSRGGKHEIGNLQLAHPICNLRKGSYIPDQDGVRVIRIGRQTEVV